MRRAAVIKAVTDTFEPLEEEDALYDLAQTLAVVGGQRSRRQAFDYQAAERARSISMPVLCRI